MRSPGARLTRTLARGLASALLALLPVAPALAAAPLAAHVLAYRDVDTLISADGVVEAVRQATLAAQIAGQVVELKVKVGDRVRAGQVLARIDARTAEQALAGSQSQLAEARAIFGNATRAYERSQQLYAQKFLSKAALDQAELDYQAARARLEAQRAAAGQAATAQTFATITAPFNGVVAATPVEAGDMATPGRALVTVFDPAEMRVLATLPQSSLRALRLQQGARIEVPGSQGSVSTTRITVLPMADSRTHTAKLRLDVADGAGLLPGQFARVYFSAGATRKLALPVGAVLRRGELTAVYVLGADGRAQLRQVRVGEAGGGFVEVLSGLREGERIALDPVKAGLGGH